MKECMLRRLFPQKHDPWRAYMRQQSKRRALEEAEAAELSKQLGSRLRRRGGSTLWALPGLFGPGHFYRAGILVGCPFPLGSVARKLWIMQT